MSLEIDMREFLEALTETEPRPVRNVTRYPQSVLRGGAQSPRGPVVVTEKTPTGFERGRVRERQRSQWTPLCATCFERTERAHTGREFCVGCATEARVVFVETDYSGASDRRMAALLTNGKPKFMF